jgi:hypothetical protein
VISSGDRARWHGVMWTGDVVKAAATPIVVFNVRQRRRGEFWEMHFGK